MSKYEIPLNTRVMITNSTSPSRVPNGSFGVVKRRFTSCGVALYSVSTKEVSGKAYRMPLGKNAVMILTKESLEAERAKRIAAVTEIDNLIANL